MFLKFRKIWATFISEVFSVNSEKVLLETFVKYTLSQLNSHCTQNYTFSVVFGDWKLLFWDEKLSKIVMYLFIYFLQKMAGLVLENIWLLRNGWSYRVSQTLAKLLFKWYIGRCFIYSVISMTWFLTEIRSKKGFLVLLI